MKAALNRIFATKASLLESCTASAITVKEESAYVTECHWDRNYKKKFHQFKGDKFNNYGKSTYPKINPTINGRVSRCRICESKYHWVKDCPHKQEVRLTEDQDEQSLETEHVKITLLTQKQIISPQEVFTTEAYNTAVIDTACTKTVCGSKWLYQFVTSLGEKSQKEITFCESKTPFKFGDGETK